MKNYQKSALFVFVLLASITVAFAASTQFSDVPANHWAYQAVEEGRLSGLWQGYEDNTFRPNNAVSRGEIAVLLDRNNEMVEAKIANKFSKFLVARSLEAEVVLKEIANPSLELPSDIHANQLEGFFAIEDTYFATVLRPSMNINLPAMPADFQATFSGLLIADKGDTKWRKLVSIADSNPSASSKNNPYYLWSDNGKIFMSVVDQNGAGSGEGIEKLYSTTDTASWELDGCYYFGSGENYPDFGAEAAGEDYFVVSKNISKLSMVQPSECQSDVAFTLY